MESMYGENILDHYKNPRNFGSLASVDAVQKEVNTLCGDEIEVQIKLKSGTVNEIKFRGKGCAISQASASMLTESVKGKRLEEVEKLKKEDLLQMLGISVSATRLKCALLSLYALKNALAQLEIRE